MTSYHCSLPHFSLRPCWRNNRVHPVSRSSRRARPPRRTPTSCRGCRVSTPPGTKSWHKLPPLRVFGAVKKIILKLLKDSNYKDNAIIFERGLIFFISVKNVSQIMRVYFLQCYSFFTPTRFMRINSLTFLHLQAKTVNGEPSIFLLPIFLLHKL